MHRSSNEIDHFASYSAAAASWYRRFAVFASMVGDGRPVTTSKAGLAAGELGLVLVDERAHAFLLVLRREQVRERLALDTGGRSGNRSGLPCRSTPWRRAAPPWAPRRTAGPP